MATDGLEDVVCGGEDGRVVAGGIDQFLHLGLIEYWNSCKEMGMLLNI